MTEKPYYVMTEKVREEVMRNILPRFSKEDQETLKEMGKRLGEIFDEMERIELPDSDKIHELEMFDEDLQDALEETDYEQRLTKLEKRMNQTEQQLIELKIRMAQTIWFIQKQIWPILMRVEKTGN